MDAVLLDTCVLLKSYLCDTLLSVAEVGTFRPLWSDHVLEELRRNLVKAGAKPEAVEHRLGQMAAYFPDARVTGYEQLIRSMTNHPKDRHVLAAAVAGRPRTWASLLLGRTTSCWGCLSCTRALSWTRFADSRPATGASPDLPPRS
jgi:hypothetical protein